MRNHTKIAIAGAAAAVLAMGTAGAATAQAPTDIEKQSWKCSSPSGAHLWASGEGTEVTFKNYCKQKRVLKVYWQQTSSPGKPWHLSGCFKVNPRTKGTKKVTGGTDKITSPKSC